MEWSSSAKNRKRLLTWKDPTTLVCGISIHKCCRHYEKLSAFSTFTMVQCSIIVLWPWHYKSFTAQFLFFTFLCPEQSISPLVSGGLTFWAGIWSSSLAQGCQLSFDISLNLIWSPCQLWCPSVSSGQSPWAHGPHCLSHCGVFTQHALLKLACQPLL